MLFHTKDKGTKRNFAKFAMSKKPVIGKYYGKTVYQKVA